MVDSLTLEIDVENHNDSDHISSNSGKQVALQVATPVSSEKIEHQHHVAQPSSNKEEDHIPMDEEGSGKVKEFVASKGLTTQQAQELLEKWGRNELAEKTKPKVSQVSWNIISLTHFYFSG